MNFYHHLKARELGQPAGSRHYHRYDVALDKYRSRSLEHQASGPLLSTAIRTPDEFGGTSRLLIGSETGLVRLLDPQQFRVVSHWSAHSNAVFEIKWRPGQDHCLTASGDTCFSVWDVSRIRNSFNPEDNVPLRRQAFAHKSTIKSASFRDENVVATGARDGNILIWDLRQDVDSAVLAIGEAHRPDNVTRSSNGHRKRQTAEQNSRSIPAMSVTAVLFRPETNFLFSSGATDAMIKLWDMRMIKTAPLPWHCPSNPSFGQVPHSVTGVKPRVTRTPALPSYQPISVRSSRRFSCHGFTSLAFDSSGHLYGSSSDHRIYAFDKFSGQTMATYSAHSYRTNIFSKMTICEDLVVSGSVGGAAPVWLISDSLRKRSQDSEFVPDVRPRVLLPHDADVTSVEADFKTGSIFSISDDMRVNRWSLFHDVGRKRSEEPSVSSVNAERQAIPYQDPDVEEMGIRIRRTDLSSVKLENSPLSIVSPLTSPATPLSNKRDPQITSIRDWLSPASTSPLTPVSSLNQTPSSSSSFPKKRSHSGAKENISDLVNRMAITPTPSSSVTRTDSRLTMSSTPGRKRVKRKDKRNGIVSRKISDYFSMHETSG